MKKIILFAFSAFLALLAGCTADSFAPVAIPNHYSVKPPEPVNERDLTEQLKKLHTPDTSPYKITPGDQFDITVYEHPELTVRQIIVTPDGFVSAPLIGPVKIGGLSLVEATEALKKQISQYIRKPLVSLIPIRINGYNFTIVGRVNVPGCYPISIGNTRLIDAVAMARGLSEGLFHGDTVELADLENAYISRDGRLLPVNFQKALLRGDPLHNIPLKNGDYIYIPSVMNSTVALLGQVGKPTYVGFKEGMTVLQALPYGGIAKRPRQHAESLKGRQYFADDDVPVGNAVCRNIDDIICLKREVHNFAFLHFCDVDRINHGILQPAADDFDLVAVSWESFWRGCIRYSAWYFSA